MEWKGKMYGGVCVCAYTYVGEVGEVVCVFVGGNKK